ncbi:unnamed protein product [marine sediment metagenome]|uniref:Uncharacterized protein n=1 Tax=marine sediment metagenome TaxID=412755 RepID=X1FBE5_9ZZZZ
MTPHDEWAGDWIEQVKEAIKTKPESIDWMLSWLYIQGVRQGWKAAGKPPWGVDPVDPNEE